MCLYWMPLSLIVCFVDFSRAFDLINRHILFYKLIKAGLRGRIVDTMRSLYAKTQFRLKCKGSLNQLLATSTGVNQDGNASSCLFRRYLADIGDCLSTPADVCFEEEVLLHLLWADDLQLVSDTTDGFQKQINGLANFCSQNLMILNEMKLTILYLRKIKETQMLKIYISTKMWFTTRRNINISGTYFQKHKQIKDIYSDMLMNTHVTKPEMLSSPLKRNWTSLRLTTTNSNSFIQIKYRTCPNIWMWSMGFHKKGPEVIDIFSLRFLNVPLKIKPSTSTIMA